MASPSSVLTMGLGAWGTPSVVVTLGYGSGAGASGPTTGRMEYTVPKSLLHYRVPNNRPQYTVPKNPQFDVPVN